jgi:hypothetical protein
MPRFSDITINDDGTFEGYDSETAGGIQFHASFDRFFIRRAWDAGMDFEAEADGFGIGMGTMGGDWSGIRDSSDEAIALMFTKAINAL